MSAPCMCFLVVYTFLMMASSFALNTGESCLTPKSVVGVCLEVRKCPPLIAILRTTPLLPSAISYLRGSQCGTNGQRPLVCCPQTKEDGSPERCVTPDKLEGECVEVSRCPRLLVKLTNNTDPTDSLLRVLRSKCGDGPGGGPPLVCCPSGEDAVVPGAATMHPEGRGDAAGNGGVRFHKNVGLLRRDICGPLSMDDMEDFFELKLYRFPWMALISFEYAEFGSSCHTPNYSIGHCIRFRNCPTLFQVLRKKPQNVTTREFLSPYDCGQDSGDWGTLYCCPIYTKEGFQVPMWGQEFIFYGNSFQCAGSIINERYILTSGACINGLPVKPTKVRIGEHDTMKDDDCGVVSDNFNRVIFPEAHFYDNEICAPAPEDVPIEEIIVHPDFRRENPENDIALVRLEKPMNFEDSTIRPICLPVGDGKQYASLTRKFMTVSSWSQHSHFGYNIWSNTGMIVEPNFCKSVKNVTDSKQFCMDESFNLFICNMLRGEPAMTTQKYRGSYRYVQLGVSAFPGNCRERNSIYTRVEPFMKWILDTMRP